MERKSEIRLIRASEIGEYDYCSRAWWYKHVAKISPGGEASRRMEHGRQEHHRHRQATFQFGLADRPHGFQ